MSLTSVSRVSLVTGGSRGIGRAVAEPLAADGHTVSILSLSNQADVAIASITEAGRTALAVRADVAEEEAVAGARVEEEFGGVDVLINTAGIMPLSPIAQLDGVLGGQLRRQ